MTTMMKRQTGAFTLIEVMIFSALSLILIGVLTQTFILAARGTEDSRTRVDLQQTAVLILKRIEADLGTTSFRAMKAHEDDIYVLAMAQIAGINENSNAIWKDTQVLYGYDPATKVLHRDEFIPAPPPLSPIPPYLPTDAELLGLAKSAQDRKLVLSPYVEEFAVTDQKGNTTAFLVNPLKLTLKFKRPLSTAERSTEFNVERRFTMRNSF